jgi:prophage regulatory protein
MPSPVNTPHSVASSASLRSGLQQRQAQSTDADGDATALVRAVVHTQGERLLRLRDVLVIVGLSRAHVYNLVKQGLFPRPIALGSNCARWVQSEVQSWVDASIVAARTPHAGRRVGRSIPR